MQLVAVLDSSRWDLSRGILLSMACIWCHIEISARVERYDPNEEKKDRFGFDGRLGTYDKGLTRFPLPAAPSVNVSPIQSSPLIDEML